MFYCEQDKCLICPQCLLIDHLKHPITDSQPYILGQKARDTCGKVKSNMGMMEDTRAVEYPKLEAKKREAESSIEEIT